MMSAIGTAYLMQLRQNAPLETGIASKMIVYVPITTFVLIVLLSPFFHSLEDV
jgi:hypothetical protein